MWITSNKNHLVGQLITITSDYSKKQLKRMPHFLLLAKIACQRPDGRPTQGVRVTFPSSSSSSSTSLAGCCTTRWGPKCDHLCNKSVPLNVQRYGGWHFYEHAQTKFYVHAQTKGIGGCSNFIFCPHTPTTSGSWRRKFRNGIFSLPNRCLKV